MHEVKSNGIGRNKKLRDRHGEILFIDARKLGHMVDRTRREFSHADIAKIADTYYAWREGEGEGFADIPGFACAAQHDVIPGHGYILTPGRYVRAEDVEEDGTPFPKRFAALQATLEGQFAESARLTEVIRQRLADVIVPAE